MPAPKLSLVMLLAAAAAGSEPQARPPGPGEWGAPPVSVSREGGTWTIAGARNRVWLDEESLAIRIAAGRSPSGAALGASEWSLVPSGEGELGLTAAGDEFAVKLTDAAEVRFEPYHTGFKSGVKITLDAERRRERTVFADGTTVTVDWETEEIQVSPPLTDQ